MIYNSKSRRASTGVDCSNDVVRTVQYQKDDADITKIVASHFMTGVFPGAPRPLQFIDTTVMPNSYEEVLNLAASTKSLFYSLSAADRARFNNNPAVFMDFAINPDNDSELEKLGFTRTVQNLDNSQNLNSTSGGDTTEAGDAIGNSTV